MAVRLSTATRSGIEQLQIDCMQQSVTEEFGTNSWRRGDGRRGKQFSQISVSRNFAETIFADSWIPLASVRYFLISRSLIFEVRYQPRKTRTLSASKMWLYMVCNSQLLHTVYCILTVTHRILHTDCYTVYCILTVTYYCILTVTYRILHTDCYIPYTAY